MRKILFLILSFAYYYNYSQTSIDVKLFSVNVAYDSPIFGIPSTYSGIHEHGLIVTIYNNSNTDYYFENGINIASYLRFNQNNVVKTEVDLGHKSDQNEETVQSLFQSVMWGGNGLNSVFNKPCEILEYSKELLQKINLSIPRYKISEKALRIIYIPAHSRYSLFYNLSDLNIKGKCKISLYYKTDFIDDKSIIMPDSIKNYKKFDETVLSDPLEVDF